MKSIFLALLFLFVTIPCQAHIFTVKADGSGDFSTIQAAIDFIRTASVGDVIELQPGVYTGPGNRDIDFLGKFITVRSIDPNDRNIVAATVIDCNGTAAEPHRGFYFHNGETANSILAGLTITNGYGLYEYLGSQWDFHGIAGGAIFCKNSNPIITKCNIKNNFADNVGAGICNSYSSPTISYCTFTNNHTTYGGGIFNIESNPVISNCEFSNNVTENEGGAIANWSHSNSTIRDCSFSKNSTGNEGGAVMNYISSNLIITNCIFNDNSASEGGAINNCGDCNQIVTNCIFYNNFAEDIGGGICNNYDSNTTVVNCTFKKNTALTGGGIYDSSNSSTIAITNSIFWDNAASTGPQFYSAVNPTYSCVQDWPTPDANNINLDPKLTWDGHLRYNSPCIEAADPCYTPGPTETDIDREQRIYGSFMDIGADEFIDTDSDGLPDWWEEKYFGSPIAAEPNANPDGDSWINIKEYNLSLNPKKASNFYYYVDPVNGNDDWNGTTMVWDGQHGPKKTIQAAIDICPQEHCVILTVGTYTGEGNRNLDFKGKPITVSSIDPNDPNIVEATIIDCESQGHGFYFHSGEGPNSIVTGLTITHAYRSSYPGYPGGAIYCSYSSPTITNCILTENDCYQYFGSGVYSEFSAPVITSCTINNNLRVGVYCLGSNSIISKCIISKNEEGGIWCTGTGQNNPSIINSIISDNIGPGISGWINNNPVGVNISITNCLIIDNIARGIAGIANCSGSVANCIIWGNGISNTPYVTYSNIEGGFPGVGNINAVPSFVDAANGDYHLQDNSPCINTGDPNYIPEPNETDLDGNPRVLNSRIDMGPYELFIPPISAEVDIKPQTLNLTSKGILTCFIRLSREYDVNEIDTAGICLKTEACQIEALIVSIDEQEHVVIAKFSRQAAAAILDAGEQVEITITGRLTDGTIFEGIDLIRVINSKLQIVADFSSHWLRTYDSDPHACKYLDVNQDSVINFVDFAMLDLLLH